ncbi:hypothetical protein [Streptomyces sp. NPDC001292]|uniref:hypothetical protein n=1 Tax=Streptomyces sp. NPDC001292 TaxID=3364558 RepID=UPI0036B00C46
MSPAESRLSGDQAHAARTMWDAIELLPLIQFDYGVETEANGYAHRNTDLTVTPSTIGGAVDAGTVTSTGLEVSYDDGATWQKADLNRSGPPCRPL